MQYIDEKIYLQKPVDEHFKLNVMLGIEAVLWSCGLGETLMKLALTLYVLH